MDVLPDWWQFLLLSLVAFRAWRLISEDDVLDRPRRWALRLGSDWQKEGDPVPDGYRRGWGLFLTCPWCAGAWVSLITYILWLATLGEWPDSAGDGAVAVGVWFAISAAVGLIRNNLDRPE